MTRTITDPTTIGIPKVRQCFKSTTEQYVSYLCKSNKLVENDGNNDRSCNGIVIENLLVVVVVVSVPNGPPRENSSMVPGEILKLTTNLARRSSLICLDAPVQLMDT